jgi:hypothetical protein
MKQKIAQFAWPFCMALAGCAPSPPARVEASVFLNDRPLPQVVVTLVPEASDVRPAIGITDAQGVCRPATGGAGQGVVPGRYKVIVVAAATGAGVKSATIPAIYSDRTRTPLSMEVPAREPVELRLRSDAK